MNLNLMKPKHVKVKRGDTVVLIGTAKGAFIARSDSRRKWDIGGPHFVGQSVYAMCFDTRGKRKRIWAATAHMHFGAVLCHSDDFGKTWTVPQTPTLTFPDDTKTALKNIWQIVPGPADEPDTLYAGVEPAALFKTTDGGKSWSLVRGLWNHPHRAKWQPGGGGLALHTILTDPRDSNALVIAISTGGVYETVDGGESWTARSKGVRAEFMPEGQQFPEFGQCVHKIARAAGEPDRIYLQNHWGLYRSDDNGKSWNDIAHKVPSDFGFPVVAHPHDPDTAYIIPLEADMFRVTPEAKLRVYRTSNGGKSWKPLIKGLPQKNAYECVLRDAMAADPHKKAGIYFGTRSGKVFASANDGDSWKVLHETLPPVLCVRAGRVAA